MLSGWRGDTILEKAWEEKRTGLGCSVSRGTRRRAHLALGLHRAAVHVLRRVHGLRVRDVGWLAATRWKTRFTGEMLIDSGIRTVTLRLLLAWTSAPRRGRLAVQAVRFLSIVSPVVLAAHSKVLQVLFVELPVVIDLAEMTLTDVCHCGVEAVVRRGKVVRLEVEARARHMEILRKRPPSSVVANEVSVLLEVAFVPLDRDDRGFLCELHLQSALQHPTPLPTSCGAEGRWRRWDR